MLPRSDSDASQSRPFDIFVSDFDVLAELNSESKVNQLLRYLSSSFLVFIL